MADGQYSSAAEIDSRRQEGRIPQELPKSTSFVQDRNDVDYDRSWGAFRFRPGDGLEASDAVEILPKEVSNSFADFPGTKWWPSFLSPRLSGGWNEQIEQSGFVFYRTRRFYIAISRSQGEGYFWRSRDLGPGPG
jgi:hypothetical protein